MLTRKFMQEKRLICLKNFFYVKGWQRLSNSHFNKKILTLIGRLCSLSKLNGDLKFTSVNVEAIDKVGVNICVVLSKLPSDAL